VYKFIRVLLFLVGLLGLLLLALGGAATRGGRIIVLPGLGLLVPGPLFFILGGILLVAALTLGPLLRQRRKFR
jgi:hypothetical protein